MRQVIPDICDVCAKEIKSEMQYCFEVFQGRTTFGDEVIQGARMDCCQPCFIKIAKNGYKPNWTYKTKNPNYVAGSKEADKKYWIIETQEQREMKNQQKLVE